MVWICIASSGIVQETSTSISSEHLFMIKDLRHHLKSPESDLLVISIHEEFENIHIDKVKETILQYLFY